MRRSDITLYYGWFYWEYDTIVDSNWANMCVMQCTHKQHTHTNTCTYRIVYWRKPIRSSVWYLHKWLLTTKLTWRVLNCWSVHFISWSLLCQSNVPNRWAHISSIEQTCWASIWKRENFFLHFYSGTFSLFEQFFLLCISRRTTKWK